ncbi:MAG: CDP-glycerol glycerophosphotransferase [Microbacteriaceae bacterium]|nr:CDP-glycerol glycerophosphotransferase [Microbacteriaceae bacterium]
MGRALVTLADGSGSMFGSSVIAKPRRFVRRVRRAVRYEIYAYWRSRPVEPKTVLYESFSGNGMLCNPEALFRELLGSSDFSDFQHVWVLSSFHEYKETVREFATVPNVRFVRAGSVAYHRALATSGYLVNNATFPPEFGKRPGQVYLNTWHGTPLKRMGYDIEDGVLATANTIRNFLSADYLLAANSFMTEQMYGSAYKLNGVFGGTVIEEGYPRIDRQFLDAAGGSAVRDRLEASGLQLDGRQIILYAPTWKGTSFSEPEDDAEELIRRVGELESQIDTERYVVLLKTHQIVHKLTAHRPAFRGRVVPNEIPTNELLGATDVLVTDYSSIFFDFLPTRRPILFLTPDIDDYAGYRGLYLEPGEWPGPVSRTVDELAAEIAALGETWQPDERYLAAVERFASNEDGGVARRIVDIVFRKQTDGYRMRELGDSRKSMLLYLGGMRPNGITSSVLNMLDHIDHERFDVSAFFANPRSPLAVAKQREVNPAVRQIPRVGGMNGSKLWHLARHLDFRRGRMPRHGTDPRQKALWDDEWTRCFGASKFDYVVDFSGYGPFWAALLLHSPEAQRSIWLHNDMVADAHRLTDGKPKMLRSLSAVAALYPEFDRLVSVSPALAEINADSFSPTIARDKFVAALNLVNATRIREDAAAAMPDAVLDEETGEVPVWLEHLEDEATTTFVSVGRLSPEKNQARLLRAFADVHATEPGARLLLVGDGPLYDDLARLIRKLRLSDVAFLAGHQSNPAAILSRADCFVLSSDYEGQPMVILEALVLDLPVVTVSFGSVRDALPEGSGLIVPSTDQGLADGLRAFLHGEVAITPFDDEAYNNAVVEQFYLAIGASTADPAEEPHSRAQETLSL